jgi:hypothetical protein
MQDLDIPSRNLYTYIYIHTYIYVYIYIHIYIPVVPHKAVAEVSKIGNYRRGWFLCFTDGRANPLMDRKVVGVVCFEVIAMVAVGTSPQLLDVVWCSTVVVVAVV